MRAALQERVAPTPGDLHNALPREAIVTGAEAASAERWLRLMPAVFVFLWSTGFIGAKLGLPYAEPARFLLLRFVFVIVLMLPIAVAVRARWPSASHQLWHIAVAGALLHGGYLGGVFYAIQHGMSAGLVSLVVGLQPILTALAAGTVLGERATPRQWLGLALGLAGVALVVMQKASIGGLTWLAMGCALVALLSITAGTLYQKRFCGAFDLRTGSVVQFAAASLVLAPFAAFVDDKPVVWSGAFVFALAWLVIVLSIAAISALTVLIRRGAATRVASLFYLVPPVTAIIAYVVFGEVLTPLAIAGMGVAILGVALVTRG